MPANAIPLHERGYRPGHHERGAVQAYLEKRLDWWMRYHAPCAWHLMMWGVPCGPTLSMVHPPVLRGLEALV